jgi:hypothetical protein
MTSEPTTPSSTAGPDRSGGTEAPAPFLGQLIGQAERATRALLDTMLARLDLPFEHWLALRLSSVSPGPFDRAGLARAIETGSGQPAHTAAAAVDGAISAGLLGVDGDVVRPSAAGRAIHGEVVAAIETRTERLTAGLDRRDVAAARRVLAVVAERARAELAS